MRVVPAVPSVVPSHRAVVARVMVALALTALVACAGTQRPVTRIVNGRIIVTRSISPDAYSHVARALLYEEEQRWDDAARELQRALPFDDGGAELRAHLAELFVRLGRLDDAGEQVQRSLQIAETVDGHLAAARLAQARHDTKAALGHYRAGAAFALSDESPDSVERAHLALADAELGALEVEAALGTVSKLVEVAPDSLRARVEQATIA
jgi:tetratricopeptide (TPR) repeat protein